MSYREVTVFVWIAWCVTCFAFHVYVEERASSCIQCSRNTHNVAGVEPFIVQGDNPIIFWTSQFRHENIFPCRNNFEKQPIVGHIDNRIVPRDVLYFREWYSNEWFDAWATVLQPIIWFIRNNWLFFLRQKNGWIGRISSAFLDSSRVSSSSSRYVAC